MAQICARAETLAGAIALGEATESERDEYRRHIAGCEPCRAELGGEREIERVMAVVAHAKSSEIWEPVPVSATQRRTRRLRAAFGYGFSAVAAAVLISLGLHFTVAANVKPLVLASDGEPRTVPSVPFHVTLEKRAAVLPAPSAQPAAAQAQQPPRLLVVHNVITLKRTGDAAESKPAARSEQTTVVAKVQPSNVPVWRRDAPLPTDGARSSGARVVSVAPVIGGRAESLSVSPSYQVRDVLPLGGETAINPQPAPIAYAQGAEGTTAFEVSVDERGAPVKCTITKSSGFLSLDDAVCKAAMKARYTPRSVNGRPTAGVYRDAFTFRSQGNTEGIQQ